MADAIRFSAADEPASGFLRVANKMMGLMLRTPVGARMDPVWLLEVKGRRTGRTVRTPVGLHVIEGQRVLLGGGRWRHNFADGDHPLRLLQAGRRIEGTGQLVTDLDRVLDVYDQLITTTAHEQDLAKASRLTGAKLEAGRVPSREETRAALEEHPRSIVLVDEA